MSISTVAIFGGAFDPVHLDHLAIVRRCLFLKLCDEVWFVPSPNRWDKSVFASEENRLAMLHLALDGDPRIRISDEEIRMGEYRGSYVTLQNFEKRCPDIHFRLLIGADSYENIPHWRDPLHFFGTEYNGPLLLRDFELIVFNRQGVPKPDPEAHRAKGYAPLFWVGNEENFCGRFSSTEIRKQLFFGHEKPEGLSPEIYRYIRKHRLYRE